MSLAGHTALVTGGGRGIGRAIADDLAARGATVYATSRDPEVAAGLGERYGTRPVVLDVRDIGMIRATIASLDDAGVDLLVNNGGINIPEPVLDIEPDSWDAVFETNVRGAFFTTQEIARGWVARGVRGSVVGIGSQAGIVAIENRVAYGASKAAMQHMTRMLAIELAVHGIRVNAVAPTFIRTALTASTLADPDIAETLLQRIPLGRFGEAEDVAGAVAYLLGPESALVTGHTLVVDGGYTIR